MVLLYWSGLPEECKVQTPAFTDTVRLYRQAHGHYGTWDMMCGTPPQVKHRMLYYKSGSGEETRVNGGYIVIVKGYNRIEIKVKAKYCFIGSDSF